MVQEANPTSPSPKRSVFRRLISVKTSKLVLTGLTLGVLSGLFFGERCASLEILGRAFVRLLQMTVLPYVVVALISGFGRLDFGSARRLAVGGGRVLLLFWALGISVIFSVRWIFPNVPSASFFSTSTIRPPADIDPLRLFIPSNPFGALADNLVPAVVLFSICIGVSLIGVREKTELLASLRTLENALSRLARVIFRFAPIGIFALSASAAGTLSLSEVSKLQTFVVAYIAGAVLVVFVAVPALVASLTSVSYGRFLRSMRSALILGFSAGSTFIVLPLIKEAVDRLHADQSSAEEKERVAEAGILVPVAFNFPMPGNLLNLVFVLFASWFHNKPFTLVQDAKLAALGILNLFASSKIAIPALLDQMRLPADAFELFLIAGVLTDNFGVASNIISIGGLAAIYVALGRRRRWASLRRLAIPVVAVVIAVLYISGLRSVESRIVGGSAADQEILLSMKVRETVEAQVYREGDEIPEPDTNAVEPGQLMVDIRHRGVLRVGYNPNALPFAFFNRHGDLVGFDVAHAHRLAADMGCTLEFFPFSYDTLGEDLEARRYDIAMSSVTLQMARLARMDFSRPYMTLHIGFVTRDHQRREWQDPYAVVRGAGAPVRLAIMRGSAYTEIARQSFPTATLVELDHRTEFFEQDIADALLTTAEQGSAWTVLYPSFALVLPEEPIGTDPIAYAIPRGEPELRIYLDHWNAVNEQGGFSESEYQRWILGRDPDTKGRRWSIATDVLGWLD